MPSHITFPPLDLPNVLLDVPLPRRNRAPEPELHARYVQGVVLAVLQEDVQHAVLVFGRLPVLPDEAAPQRLEGEGDLADFGG